MAGLRIELIGGGEEGVKGAVERYCD